MTTWEAKGVTVTVEADDAFGAAALFVRICPAGYPIQVRPIRIYGDLGYPWATISAPLRTWEASGILSTVKAATETEAAEEFAKMFRTCNRFWVRPMGTADYQIVSVNPSPISTCGTSTRPEESAAPNSPFKTRSVSGDTNDLGGKITQPRASESPLRGTGGRVWKCWQLGNSSYDIVAETPEDAACAFSRAGYGGDAVFVGGVGMFKITHPTVAALAYPEPPVYTADTVYLGPRNGSDGFTMTREVAVTKAST